MANQSVPTPLLTKAVGFKEIPAQDNKALLQVCEGLDPESALNDASCLEGAVRKLLDNAAAGDGMCGDVAHVCEFAMATAQALRSASYGR